MGNPQNNGGKVPWYQSRKYWMTLGIILIVLGIGRVLLGVSRVYHAFTQDEAQQTQTVEADDRASTSDAKVDTPNETEPDTEADSATSDNTTSSSPADSSWNEACLGIWGDPTLYAIDELKGWQLNQLMDDSGYAWDSSLGCWGTDNFAFAVTAPDGTNLDRDAIGSLGPGGIGSQVFFQLHTNDYHTIDLAYQELVADVVSSEGSEFADGAGFAVAYGSHMDEYLVELLENDDGTVTIYFFPEHFLAEGGFSELVGEDYGSTAPEIFKNIMGREVS